MGDGKWKWKYENTNRQLTLLVLAIHEMPQGVIEEINKKAQMIAERNKI